MDENAFAPPRHEPAIAARRGARGSESRAFLLLATGALSVLLRARISIGDIAFDVLSDGAGYALFAYGAWRLRSSSPWFRYVVPVALVFVASDIARTFVVAVPGPWLSSIWAAARIGAISLALFGSATFAEKLGAASIASRARIANAAQWIALGLLIAGLTLQKSLPNALTVIPYVANVVAICLGLLVFSQLSGHVERESAAALRLGQRVLGED